MVPGKSIPSSVSLKGGYRLIIYTYTFASVGTFASHTVACEICIAKLSSCSNFLLHIAQVTKSSILDVFWYQKVTDLLIFVTSNLYSRHKFQPSQSQQIQQRTSEISQSIERSGATYLEYSRDC